MCLLFWVFDGIFQAQKGMLHSEEKKASLQVNLKMRRQLKMRFGSAHSKQI